MISRFNMAKYPKFRLSFLSFQLCRSRNPSSLPATPLSKTLSRVNSKAFDIAYPGIIPNPPPSTPNHDGNFVGYSKINPLDCGCRLTTCISTAPDQYKKDGSDHQIFGGSNNNISNTWSVVPPSSTGKKKKKQMEESKPNFSHGGYSVPSLDENKKKNRSMKNGKLQRPKHGMKGTNNPEKESGLGRIMPCCCMNMTKGKVSESFAVVKRSMNPYKDFKKSMLEMIIEKQIMFEAMEMEHLLHCFLSLNSQQHHPVILEVFTEIWEEFFTQ